jgi:hypothetical protein
VPADRKSFLDVAVKARGILVKRLLVEFDVDVAARAETSVIGLADFPAHSHVQLDWHDLLQIEEKGK